jgi:uncharacterized membrane protein YccC
MAPATQTSETPSTGAVASAVRAAAHFDRSAVSVAGGLLAAIPVVVVLGVGIAIGQPVAGVTMGAGAMLVGIAWRVTGGRPPVGVMTADALVMALSTFVGCVTGSVTWLHLVVLCLWSLMGGLLVGVGNRGGVVGNQAIIAVVVFGRFSEPAPAALGLAALVLTGGLAQVLLQSIVRWPPPLRTQRAATAAAYRELAKLARASDTASALAPAAALDDAQASLESPTLFGDSALMTLRSLVSEAYRLRIELVALHALLRQYQPPGGHEPLPAPIELARPGLPTTATALELAAEVLEGHLDREDELRRVTDEFSQTIQEDESAASSDPVERQILRRLEAVAGQLRAITSLAPAVGAGGGLRSRRPVQRTNRPRERARAHLDQLRANMSMQSPAARHAIRLAVVVPVATLIARELPLERSYWMVVAAAAVLRPEFGATFTRGAERAGGTTLGVGLAGAIAVALHPTPAVSVVLVGLLAWAGYATFPASFAVGFAFITALVVFLLNVISPDTLATAAARLVDTLIGGTIGLVAYAVWPTWSKVPAWQSLANLVAAERVYVNGVLTAITEGRRVREQQMARLSRRARLARTQAESVIARSLSEPATRRIDADRSQAVLSAMRRLIQAAHVLRLDAQDDKERRALPQLEAMRADFDAQLQHVETTFRLRPDEPISSEQLPDLRERYVELQRSLRGDVSAQELLAELDEMVDAANGLAAATGLESVDGEGAPPEEPDRSRRTPAWLARIWS